MNLTPITRALAKAAHHIEKNAPTILTVAGVAGGVTASVLGARAAMKSDPIIKELELNLAMVKESEQYGLFETRDEKIKSQVAVYVHSGKKMAKLYGPAISLGVVSVAAILYGHGMLRSRNAALMTAYASLERSFAAYRAKVKASDSYTGEQADKVFAHGVEQGEDKDAEPQWVRDEMKAHLYTRVFDDHNANWSPHSDYNWSWLVLQERILNDQLTRKGHLFLNDALRALGYDDTTEGAIVGWQFDGDGDGFVDFRLDKAFLGGKSFGAFCDGDILIDFNVDGVIYDKI